MSFDNVTFTLAAALAASGTVTVGYPSNRSQGNYDWSPGRHVLYAGGNKYVAPNDFTLTFNANASNITLTWGASNATLPISTTCRLQIDRAGPDELAPPRTPFPSPLGVTPLHYRPFLIDLGSPLALSSTGIAASQSVSANGSFTLALTTLDVPRNVTASWTGTAILTITGKDALGNTVVETTASGTSHTGKKAFKQITSITSNASITSATVGYGDVLGLPIAINTKEHVLAEFQDGALLARLGPAAFSIPYMINQTDLLAPTAQEIVAPCAGRIVDHRAVVQVAVTTGGTLTPRIGTTNLTGGVVTVANSATKGTVNSGTAITGANTIAAGDRINILPASFATAGAVNGEIVIQPDTTLRGTFVASVATTKPSGTTGDVFGTWTPPVANDGDKGWMLLVLVADARARGPDQYVG